MRKRGASPGNGNNCTHNLKVIGSNPIPATKTKRRQVNDLAALFFLRYTGVFRTIIEPKR